MQFAAIVIVETDDPRITPKGNSVERWEAILEIVPSHIVQVLSAMDVRDAVVLVDAAEQYQRAIGNEISEVPGDGVIRRH